jgi:hypothetical protein
MVHESGSWKEAWAFTLDAIFLAHAGFPELHFTTGESVFWGLGFDFVLTVECFNALEVRTVSLIFRLGVGCSAGSVGTALSVWAAESGDLVKEAGSPWVTAPLVKIT